MLQKIKAWLSKRPELLWSALIFCIAFVQYANTLGHSYAWDDDIVIVYNKRVQRGFSGIPDHFKFRTRENFEDFTGYRPVTMTSFSIDIGLFGMRPWAGHLMNVLLFGLLCIVLFRTLRHLFPDFHAAIAFFITLLFVVHPLHVEAVANIKSRDEILSLLFALLSLQFFIRHYCSGKWLQLVLSAIFVLLGALSKEGALTFFAVIPATVIIALEGTWKEKLTGLLKFPLILFLTVAVFFILTGKPPGSPSPVATKAYIESQSLGNCMAVKIPDTWQRIGNMSFLFGKNFEKFFYPRNLVYFSGAKMYSIKDWTQDRTQLGLIWGGFLLLSAGLIVFWRKTRPLIFGWMFFVFTVSIYLQWPSLLLADTIADRFMFMPSVGLCIFFVLGLATLLRIDNRQSPFFAWGRTKSALQPSQLWRLRVFGVVMAGLTILLSGMTFSRNRVWKDNLTLFTHDLPLLENCARAHYYYAGALAAGFDQAKDPAKSKSEIIQHYLRAIEITPESYYAFVRLGDNYQRWKDYAAEADLAKEALKYYPGQADIWHQRGMSLYYLGQYEEAVAAMDQSRILAPELDDNWEFLARAQARAHLYDASFATLDEALKRNASYLFYYDALSDTYFDSGDTAKSFGPVLRLIELDGQNPVWWRKLIGRYQIIGDDKSAAYYYQQSQARGIVLQ